MSISYYSCIKKKKKQHFPDLTTALQKDKNPNYSQIRRGTAGL